MKGPVMSKKRVFEVINNDLAVSFIFGFAVLNLSVENTL